MMVRIATVDLSSRTTFLPMGGALIFECLTEPTWTEYLPVPPSFCRSTVAKMICHWDFHLTIRLHHLDRISFVGFAFDCEVGRGLALSNQGVTGFLIKCQLKCEREAKTGSEAAWGKSSAYGSHIGLKLIGFS